VTLRALPSETRYITREQLAERMGCSVKTVDRLKGEGMPFVSWGRRMTRFDADAAMRWAAQQRRDAA
jgi:phage terminase Nu1 subunit (DNA packaging protein)